MKRVFMNNLSTTFFCIILVFLFTSSKPEKGYYSELYRPQFHFSPAKNWSGPPSGLVYNDGEYHMFYEYNPDGMNDNFRHWGHAVSKDLIHWEHLPVAIGPDEESSDSLHCSIYPGSVIVDNENVFGRQKGDEKTLVAFYTSQFCGQRIAYSNDNGRAWQKFEDNPIIPYSDEDDAHGPKVIWYESAQKWVMLLYRKTSGDERSEGVSFYSSDNLVDWNWMSHLYGFSGTPDIVKMSVTNRPEEEKWVLFDVDGSYMIGNFDGEEFTLETIKMDSDFGNNYYAPKTWNTASGENNDVIQIAWMRGGEYPQMPFNGQMTFPSELSLTKFSFGYKLVRKPLPAIEELHGKSDNWENKVLIPGLDQNMIKKISGDCLHFKCNFDLKTSDSFGFFLRKGRNSSGVEILYNVRREVLTAFGKTVPLIPTDNKISLEILIDRTSIEIYANDGQTVISNCFTPDEKADEYELFTNGGELEVISMDVFEMGSMWDEN